MRDFAWGQIAASLIIGTANFVLPNAGIAAPIGVVLGALICLLLKRPDR